MSHTTAELTAVERDFPTRYARRLRRLPDFLMIASIVTLVVLTSLPRLRAFVLRSNELDAREMALKLAALEIEGTDLARCITGSSELRRSLQDGTLSEGGTLLCYHGFCFTIEPDAPGARAVIAWPELAGESGVGTYIASSSGELWVHPNPDGRWSGLERRPAGMRPSPDAGWRRCQTEVAAASAPPAQ